MHGVCLYLVASVVYLCVKLLGLFLAVPYFQTLYVYELSLFFVHYCVALLAWNMTVSNLSNEACSYVAL